jgi:hypothetical protein
MMKNIADILSKIKRGENVIYRGHADCNWELKPSIGRHYSGDWSNVLDHEQKSLESFKKRSIPHLKYTPSADIEWLCLMQHHGCATRLLDFTSNPLIALFFASDPVEQEDGEIVMATYGRTYENVSDENLFERSHNFAYHPPHITERIIGQSGCFVYSRTPNQELKGKQIETIEIPEDKKYRIRSELKSLGVSYSSLFPGMDGVCRDLNDALVFELFGEELDI